MLQLFIAIAALAQNPPVQSPGAPSDEPAPSEAPKSTPAPSTSASVAATAAEAAKPMRLGGFDLSLTVFNSSGVYFGSEAYTNTLTFWIEPSFAIGKRFFKDRWLEKLAISARVPIEVELAGSDPRFRGNSFGSGNLLNAPESLPVLQAQAPGSGQVDGTVRRPVLLGDSWISLSHGKLFTVPKLGIDASSSLRVGIPTSSASRISGLLTSVSLGLVLEKKLFERLTLGYAIRPTKYFYSRTTGAISALGGSVEINGKLEPTLTYQSTGNPNPDYGFLNGFWATVELPLGFSVSANYFLFNTKPYDVTGGCGAAGVAGSNLCADSLGTKGAWRNEQWFLASVDYAHSFWDLSLGISTFRSLNKLDHSVAQPIFQADRDNYTTIYLSFSARAEAIAQYVAGEGKK